jgi:hypothetical protein
VSIDMPRISDVISIDDNRNYKAVRPQNGDTPATFREVADKPTIELSLLNLGVTQDKSRTRVRLSLVQPQINAEGVISDTNRADINVRLANTTSLADLDQFKADLIAIILSDEFEEAIAGEQQY